MCVYHHSAVEVYGGCLN